MNPPPFKKGVNGAHVLTEEGVGDARVTLFTMLNRDLGAREIEEGVKRVIRAASAESAEGAQAKALHDLWIMAFHTRDIRGGKGERDLFTHFFLSLHHADPPTAAKMLPLIPEYGSWRDLWPLYRAAPHDLQHAILALVRTQYQIDLKCYRNDQPLSLLAKWLPRERSDRPMARILARTLFPEATSLRRQLILYRLMVSAMNKDLHTVEVHLCGRTWSDIQPSQIPGRSFKRYQTALLNLPRKGDHPAGQLRHPAGQLRHPADPDRMACRANVLRFLEDVKTGKQTIHGASTVMPHELVENAYRRQPYAEEQQIIQAQWNAIREATEKAAGLRRALVMCDFSGSMEGTPLDVSLAMGILISEITQPPFRHHILTFDAEPRWHRFEPTATLYEKILSTRGSGKGLNTDFEKACRCILEEMITERVPIGEEPTDLIVITDMGFDEAHANAHSPFASHASLSPFAPPQAPSSWDGQLARIRRAFVTEGERLWETGWTPPRIVIWNVRAEYNDFHATADQEGVIQLSGWSPHLLQALQSGTVTVQTPYEGMRAVLDDPRYDAVRTALEST